MHVDLSFRLSAAIAFCLALTSPSVFAETPNVLVIMADDLGYGDLSCMGSQFIKTPHIDQLAADGTIFTQAYVASSVCSPSRAGFMTGRDPRRFGYEGNLNASAKNYATRPELLGLPVAEHTLADQLKNAGYRTGIVGKWHLGDGDLFHPNQRGFDYFCGMRGGGHDYFPLEANKKGKNKIERNGELVKEFSSEYLTDFFSDEAIRWINEKQEESWFLFLSYNAPHTPMQATEADLQLYAHIKDEKRRTYAAMVHAMDRGIGRVLATLEQTQQSQKTFVVFLSDNGGATSNASWNGSLSGAKGTLLEGGIRVPMIWRWPNHVPAGNESKTVVSSLDLLPTFLAAADAQPLPLNPAASHEDRQNRQRMVKLCGEYDGTNVLPLLAKNALRERPLFWRLQGQAALLHGDRKLIRLAHRPAQLFNPATDPSEQIDLADQKPTEFREAFTRLSQWEASLATVPLWDSSPYWSGDSAKIYDTWQPRSEPN